VPGGTPLAAVAKASGATVAAIRELNPHFLRGMTPPGDRMQVRIPVGAAASFDASLSALSRDERTATHTIVSRKGQTVDGIAEAHGIAASALESFNPHLRHLKPSGKLVTGQAIVLPTPAVASAALHVPDPSIEKYGSSTRRLKTHTVRRGETVRSIARKFDMTPERLMRLNGLRKPVIFAGQDLILSGTPKGVKSAKGARGTKSKGAKASNSAKASKASKASKGSKGAKVTKAVKAGSAAKASKSGTPARSGKTATKKQTGAGSRAGARKTAVKKGSAA
jgi:membrane-bound lytic murein transglycosylase D